MNCNLLAVALLLAAPSLTFAQSPAIEGKYTSPGESLAVERLAAADQYRITATLKDGAWESVGYYSSKCQCIKSVFRYTSPEGYKGAAGYHRFDVKDGGSKLIKSGGGWEGLAEFGKIEYTKAN